MAGETVEDRDAGRPVAGPSDTRTFRTWTRCGLAITALLALISAERSLADGPWPPVTRAFLIVAALVAVVAHVATAGRALSGAASPLPGLAATAATVVALAVALAVRPEAAPFWLLPVGVALSALGMARGWRRSDAPVLVVAVIVAGAALAWFGVPERLPALRPLLGLVVAVPVLIDLSQFWVWRVVLHLDDAREMATELSATRERERIAAELHDVQGHSLHVIAMRAELVERLLPSDPAAAREHARAVRELAAEAMAETRALVQGYRTGDVAAEVRNAVQVLRAAGAEVLLRGDPAAIPAPVADVFAALVREGTTNVLRHSNPDVVEIRVERDAGTVRVAVSNDGVHEPGAAAGAVGGTGVRGLHERFARVGGSVHAGPTGPDRTDVVGWTLSGRLPVGAGRASTDTGD